jgi:hypothetical protein
MTRILEQRKYINEVAHPTKVTRYPYTFLPFLDAKPVTLRFSFGFGSKVGQDHKPITQSTENGATTS